MNDQQLDHKVRQDAAKVKKDFNTLLEDSATRLSRLGDNVTQATGKAKDDLTTWVEGNVSQVSEGLEKLSSDAKVTVVSAAESVKKDIGNGMIQYNAKAQEVANRVPGGFGKKAARYPWIAMSIALVAGFLLGILFRPMRQSIG